jgi:peroxiredoxin Q/BCP
VVAATKRNLPSAGSAAPDFRLPDASGMERSLAEFRGKWLVLYFFPRADTPG